MQTIKNNLFILSYIFLSATTIIKPYCYSVKIKVIAISSFLGSGFKPLIFTFGNKQDILKMHPELQDLITHLEILSYDPYLIANASEATAQKMVQQINNNISKSQLNSKNKYSINTYRENLIAISKNDCKHTRKEYGIVKNTKCWTSLTKQNQLKILKSKAKTQLMTEKSQLEAQIRHIITCEMCAYIPNPEANKVIDKLVEYTLNPKKFNKKHKLLQDIILGKAYPKARECFVADNDILKLYKDIQMLRYLPQLTLHESLPKEFKEALIVEINKLHSYARNAPKQKRHFAHKALLALNYIKNTDDIMLLQYARCIMKAAEDEPYYLNKLVYTKCNNEMSMWPFKEGFGIPYREDFPKIKAFLLEAAEYESKKNSESLTSDQMIFFDFYK